jgi:hypothetical protein
MYNKQADMHKSTRFFFFFFFEAEGDCPTGIPLNQKKIFTELCTFRKQLENKILNSWTSLVMEEKNKEMDWKKREM